LKIVIRIGTRGSKLALFQAKTVCKRLQTIAPQVKFDLVQIKTKGDVVTKGPIASLGVGIFTREIEEALLENKIDLAIHSAKDLAAFLPSGLVIGAVLEREDPRDCFVSRGNVRLIDLKQGASIGTSSLRRKSQLRKMRPDFTAVELRGNVDTRIKKIEKGECDGMVLAYAGLKRLGLTQFATEIFDVNDLLPQAGQGCVAIQMRKQDGKVKSLMEKLNHEDSFLQLEGERAFLGELQGGCQIPAGITSSIYEVDKNDLEISFRGAVFSLSGDKETSAFCKGPLKNSAEMGKKIAQQVLASGGKEILEEIRSTVNG
jgi:hydroxymethylbilane synthase